MINTPRHLHIMNREFVVVLMALVLTIGVVTLGIKQERHMALATSPIHDSAYTREGMDVTYNPKRASKS